MSDDILGQVDEWLKEESEAAALVMLQWLEPVEGKGAVIFPPTYTLKDTQQERRARAGEDVPGCYLNNRGDASGYNLDHLGDGTSVCQIDSVGSQANRMEPIFMRDPYRALVPKVVVKVKGKDGEKDVNLLEAGHRAADAIIRFSSLRKSFEDAFRAIKNQGDAEPLAKLAPTSLVFGAWDSRATQVKLPRVVRSVIRAYDVQPLHRSAQYIPPFDYVGEGVLDAPQGKTEQDSMSQLGFQHAPAPWTHGGVRANEIRREATLNLAALRSLNALAKNSLPLRRYVLGLALAALTAHQETSLREGCQLVADAGRAAVWSVVGHDGQREPLHLSHPEVMRFALETSRVFKVGPDSEGTFDAKSARAELAQSKEERKKSRRIEKNAGSDGE